MWCLIFWAAMSIIGSIAATKCEEPPFDRRMNVLVTTGLALAFIANVINYIRTKLIGVCFSIVSLTNYGILVGCLVIDIFAIYAFIPVVKHIACFYFVKYKDYRNNKRNS